MHARTHTHTHTHTHIIIIYTHMGASIGVNIHLVVHIYCGKSDRQELSIITIKLATLARKSQAAQDL